MPVRDRGVILGELRSLVSTQKEAGRQLAEVRAHEIQLMSGIAGRAERIDATLDELIDWQALHAMESLR